MDKSHTVAQLVRALLANSKVPGSSPGGQCRLNFIFQGNPSKMVPIDSALGLGG